MVDEKSNVKVTRTIKLKFLNLNNYKAGVFAEMTQENTRVANYLLTIPYRGVRVKAGYPYS